MEPELLRWVWLGAGVVLLVGEMATTGLFALPFAIGAFAAAAAAFLGAPVALQLALCAGVTFVAYLALRPLAARLDRTGRTTGIGSRRLIDEPGTVIAAIPPGDDGMVRIDREEWRAESYDGRAIEEGARIRVLDVRGTRVVVAPFEAPVPELPD